MEDEVCLSPNHWSEISETKWTEAKKWSYDRINWKKYQPSKKQLPVPTVARSRKRLASRFYQLKIGHARTGEYLHKVKSRPFARCCWCERRNTRALLQKCPAWKDQQKWRAVREATNRGKDRFQRCSEGSLEYRNNGLKLGFLATTDVGRTVPPAEMEDEGPQLTTFPEDGSEASGMDDGKRRKLSERRGQISRLGLVTLFGTGREGEELSFLFFFFLMTFL